MSTPAVTPALPASDPSQGGLNSLVEKVRGMHPGAYDDLDDATLTKRVLDKYPQYSDLAAPKIKPPSVKMDTGEGPIAQGMTTFETRLSEMPKALLKSAVTPGHQASDTTQSDYAQMGAKVKALNPIATGEGSLPMNIGATAANILPLLIDPEGGGLADSPLGEIASRAKNIEVAPKVAATAKVLGKEAVSRIPFAGRLVERPSIGDYVRAVTAKSAEEPKTVGAPIERDATRENVPYAGEEEATPKAKQVGEPQWPANYTQPKQVGGGANYSAEDLAKLKARNGIADVPSEKVGEAKPTVNSVGNQIESALGGKKLIPNVPLRQQLPALQKGPVAMAEPEHMGQFARANSLELHKAIPETVEGDVLRARIHNLSNVDVRQLAIDSGEDMGQMRVGNRKGTDDLPRQEVLKRILSHHTPEQIGELMDKRAKQGNTP